MLASPKPHAPRCTDAEHNNNNSPLLLLFQRGTYRPPESLGLGPRRPRSAVFLSHERSESQGRGFDPDRHRLLVVLLQIPMPQQNLALELRGVFVPELGCLAV